jgi:hypothetical protein
VFAFYVPLLNVRAEHLRQLGHGLPRSRERDLARRRPQFKAQRQSSQLAMGVRVAPANYVRNEMESNLQSLTDNATSGVHMVSVLDA